MARRTATINATCRLRRQMLTIRLIIEKYASLDNDAVAGIQPLVDTGAIALSVTGDDRTLDEGPGRNLDKHDGAVVIHEQRRIRHEDRGFLRYIEARICKHIGFEPASRIGEGYPDLVAACVRFHHIAYERYGAVKDLSRVGCKRHV